MRSIGTMRGLIGIATLLVTLAWAQVAAATGPYLVSINIAGIGTFMVESYHWGTPTNSVAVGASSSLTFNHQPDPVSEQALVPAVMAH
jgi:hypothetical protein